METIEISGHVFEGHSITTEHACILMITAPRGLLGCGYIAPETAEKVGDAVVIVTGVKSFDDMLAAPVKIISSAAAKLGITDGMTGREALLKMV